MFHILPFPDKFLDLHPQNFLMTFFSHRPPQIPPLFRENYYFPPTFRIFHLCFRKIHLLFTYFTCISFPPYFDRDAFMHHPMHVLDAPAPELCETLERTISTAVKRNLSCLFSP